MRWRRFWRLAATLLLVAGLRSAPGCKSVKEYTLLGIAVALCTATLWLRSPLDRSLSLWRPAACGVICIWVPFVLPGLAHQWDNLPFVSFILGSGGDPWCGLDIDVMRDNSFTCLLASAVNAAVSVMLQLRARVKEGRMEQFRSGVFISYSHADRAWVERLRKHLAPYLRGGRVVLWEDSQIAPGTDWRTEIDRAIHRARVAVLLVSADFLASEFVIKEEMPAIHRAGLTLLWIPIRPSGFEVTPLKNYQAAFDPSHPLSTLTASEQDTALVGIARKVSAAIDINAVANALQIIDDFELQAKALSEGTPELEQPAVHSRRTEQVQGSINLIDPGGERQIITTRDLEELDAGSQKLVRAYERTLKDLFERWTELMPKRHAQDTETRREAREESSLVRDDLCATLNGLLRFLESNRVSFRNHYAYVRHICSQQSS
jgi:hypothetical protein